MRGEEEVRRGQDKGKCRGRGGEMRNEGKKREMN